MRLLFATLAVLGTAIALTLLAQHDPGYVLITYANWSVESSLSLFLVVLVASFALLYLTLRLLTGAWRLPKRLRYWKRGRRSMRSQLRTNRGLIALAEGNWTRAERLLSRSANSSQTPLLNYLGAARAAQKLGAEQRRDNYLSQAYQSMPEAELAVGLTQVEVQLSQGQAEQALASLRHLRSIAPKHSYVLYLLKKLYEKLESWDDLYELLPELRRQNVLNAEELAALEKRIHEVRFCQAGSDPERLQRYWEMMPKSYRQQPDLILDYANQLKVLGAEEVAERQLREYLKKSWHPQLIRLYGQIKGADPEQQLAVAERWLKEHENHPELLLACGRLSLYSKFWGKARSYLEASLGAEGRAETCCELGNLLQQTGDKEKAAAYFRQGLELASGSKCTNVVLPHHTDSLHLHTDHPMRPALPETEVSPENSGSQ